MKMNCLGLTAVLGTLLDDHRPSYVEENLSHFFAATISGLYSLYSRQTREHSYSYFMLILLQH